MFQHSTHLHTGHLLAFISEVNTKHIFRVLSIPSDPFQELNMFQHSPPHQSLVGPLPCHAMVTHQYHRVDQPLNRIMMIILHFRILNLSILYPFPLCPILSCATCNNRMRLNMLGNLYSVDICIFYQYCQI